MQGNIVEVAPDVSGLITSIEVVDNQKVAKGDILFVIDRERFALAVEQAQANVAQGQWTSKLAQDNADRDAQVMKNDSGAISIATAEASRAKAGEAGAALQLARSQLATAQLNLERSTVRSPVNGFVTNLTATVGNYASQGAGVLALVDSDSFYVYAYFMETKLPAIRIGSEAEVRLMAGGAVLRGKVQGLSRAIANPPTRAADCSRPWTRISNGSGSHSVSPCVSRSKRCRRTCRSSPVCLRPWWFAASPVLLGDCDGCRSKIRPGLRRFPDAVETAGGGRSLASKLFDHRLYIVAAISVWFQT